VSLIISSVRQTINEANIAESVVDLILLAPEEERAKLLAATTAQLGQAFLEKTGAIEGDSNMTH
jgi:hypothetical protein